MSLFDTEMISVLSSLALDVSGDGRRRSDGLHRSRRPGSGMEFHDYRDYSPGDDLRRMDWNIFSRHRRLVVRRNAQHQRLRCRLVFDNSLSLHFEPIRRNAALYSAAAIGAAVLNGGDVLEVDAGAHGRRRLFRRGSRDLLSLLEHLEYSTRKPDETPGLPYSYFKLHRKGYDLSWFTSDFFDPSGVESMKTQLEAIPGCVGLVRIMRPSDATPQLEPGTQVELCDCETAALMKVTVDDELTTRYKDNYRSFVNVLNEFTRMRNSRYFEVNADLKPFEQIKYMFPSGILRVN
jgi:hypothetical protein